MAWFRCGGGVNTDDANATATQILKNFTAYVKGKKETGTMENKSGTTVDAGAVTQDDTYTYMDIPAAGYYDTNSKLRSANSNLNDSIYNAIIAAGVTPVSKNIADLVAAIGTLANKKPAPIKITAVALGSGGEYWLQAVIRVNDIELAATGTVGPLTGNQGTSVDYIYQP